MAQLRRKKVHSVSRKLGNPIAKAMNKAKHSSFYHDLSLRGKHPLRLLGTPNDIWSGSVMAGTQIVRGKMVAAGHVLKNPDNSEDLWPKGTIWTADHLSEKWLEHLHSFAWLRDLNQAVDSDVAQMRAEELVEKWIDYNTQWGEISWRPDIVGIRIINWLVYAPLIMNTDDVVYRGRVLDILARSARHLYKVSSDLPEGPDGLYTILGLVFSGLYIPFGEEWLKEGLNLIKFSLGKEVLFDGGLRSRNPHDVLHLFMMMYLLRDSLKDRSVKVPPELDLALKRMSSNLRSIIHMDGKLSLFNGSYIQTHEDIYSSLLKVKDDNISKSGLINDMEQSGFCRISNGNTLIIQDVGPPSELELSRACHSGALSFEMSRGKERVVVNCGSAAYISEDLGHGLYAMSRSTAAHSTLIINDHNSSEVSEDGLIGRGITETTSQRFSENNHILIDTSHDGYVDQFGFIHKRLIYLNDTGQDVRGEDILEQADDKANVSDEKFDIRFHLHPNVSVLMDEDENIFRLILMNGEKWSFRYRGAKGVVEDSLYFGEAGKISQCKQIILSGKTDGSLTSVLWSLSLNEVTD